MNRLYRVLALLVFVAIAMVGAYQVGYYTAAARSASSASGLASQANVDAEMPSGTPFDVLWETWRLVQREFYDKNALDARKLSYGAINGMLGSLGDSHTLFADPTHSRVTEDDMRGAFDGIGVTVEMRDKRLTIVAPLDDSPGAKAGLRAGDVVLKVDERDISGLTILEAVGLIRGRRGTTVRLLVQRPGDAEPRSFDIVRAEIKMVSVRARMLDDAVAYVKLTQFSQPTGRLLQQQLTTLLASKPKALILDLRNNPGGLLSSAIEVASEFIGDGVLMYEQRRDAEMEVFTSKGGGLATALPIIVLINPGSASASEIVAGAIQDRGRGTLIGEHTFGKDTVQNVHQLSDKSSVRITIAKWYTPNKQQIAGKGLMPDISVVLTEDDMRAGRDPQLDRALEMARGES